MSSSGREGTVQVCVQVAWAQEGVIGETHGKEQEVTNRESKNGQPHNVDDHVHDMKRARAHLSQCVVQHIIQHAHCAQKKVTCDVCCLHSPSVTVECYQL